MWRKLALGGKNAFRRAMRRGHRLRRGQLTFYLHARSGPSRLGLIVVLNPRSAVSRNRIRRRLRAVARQALPSQGWDVVVRADHGAATAEFQEMVSGMASAIATSTTLR